MEEKVAQRGEEFETEEAKAYFTTKERFKYLSKTVCGIKTWEDWVPPTVSDTTPLSSAKSSKPTSREVEREKERLRELREEEERQREEEARKEQTREKWRNELLEFSNFRVLKFTRVWQALFYFLGYTKEEICHEGTNALDWNKAKHLLTQKLNDQHEFFFRIFGYTPFGPKEEEFQPYQSINWI